MALLDPYTGPWTTAEAAHLARRTSFGARPIELATLVNAGMSIGVDYIVNYLPVDQPLEDSIAALPANADNDKIKTPITANELEGWWLYRMVNSTQPMQQQFALFLHDHFVSEYGKIQANVTNNINYGNDGSASGQNCTVATGGLPPDTFGERKVIARLFRDQHQLFLKNGHESFREMLIKITRDPCMLIYLDNRLNIKGKPQENYGREIMELFSMGVGNYSEEDVRNAAKAFTGETIRTGCLQNWPYDYFYNTGQHDTTDKKMFGITFNHSTIAGADSVRVIDLILDRISGSAVSPAHSTYPATAIYMSWKLINWFVNESVPIAHPAVAELADYLYNFRLGGGGGYNYNMRETLRKLLKSQFFYDQTNRYKVYKHPADYVVGALRNLELAEPKYASTASYNVREMGMRLFEPPTVEGWHHGRSWVNSSSLIARFNYADRMSTSAIFTDAAIDALITQRLILNINDDTGIRNYFSSRLLLDTLTADEVAVFTQLFSTIKGAATTTQAIYRRKVRGALHLTMTMPRYQLK